MSRSSSWLLASHSPGSTNINPSNHHCEQHVRVGSLPERFLQFLQTCRVVQKWSWHPLLYPRPVCLSLALALPLPLGFGYQLKGWLRPSDSETTTQWPDYVKTLGSKTSVSYFRTLDCTSVAVCQQRVEIENKPAHSAFMSVTTNCAVKDMEGFSSYTWPIQWFLTYFSEVQ